MRYGIFFFRRSFPEALFQIVAIKHGIVTEAAVAATGAENFSERFPLRGNDFSVRIINDDRADEFCGTV